MKASCRRKMETLIVGFLIILPLASKGDTLAELRGVWRADFNDDVSRVVVQLRSGAVSIWDTVSGAVVCADVGKGKETDSYSLRPDHKAAFIALRPDGAQIVSLSSGELLSSLLDVNQVGRIEPNARFSPDNATLVVVDNDRRAHVFDVQTGKRRIEPVPLAGSRVGDTENNFPAKFSADGNRCFLMDSDGKLFRFDTRTWKQVGEPVQHPHREGYSFGFDVSPDGRWLATFDSPGEHGPKGVLQVWDVETGKAVGSPVEGGDGIAAEFLVQPNRLLRQPGRGGVGVYDVSSGELRFGIRSHDDLYSPQVAVSPDGMKMISFGPDRFLTLQDGQSGEYLGGLPASASASSVFFAPDSKTCFIVFDNSAFSLQGHYDHYVMRVVLTKMEIDRSIRVLDFIHRIVLSPDGQRMIVIQGRTDRERVRIIDTATMKPLDGYAE